MKRFLYLIVLYTSCNLDVNTTDPQASKNIFFSKTNNFFLKEYQVDINKTFCKINEAWVEYVWKNEIVNGKKKRKRLEGTQLLINLDYQNLPLISEEYLISWELINSTYGVFGRGNGVFILDLDDKNIPDKFEILLNKKDDNWENVCTISLNIK